MVLGLGNLTDILGEGLMIFRMYMVDMVLAKDMFRKEVCLSFW